jgi:hypothetical protein
MIILRVHHLLCQGFYSGHGYSSEFVNNMDVVIEKLRSGDEKIVLTTQCDDVCLACPNQSSADDSVCILNNNGVHIKDIMLLHSLGLTSLKPYDAKNLGLIVEKNLTKEIFENSCNKCDWYKQGFCNAEKWKNMIGNKT